MTAGQWPRRKAGELGFEPRLTESESVVLPLHHSPKTSGYERDKQHALILDAMRYVTPDVQAGQYRGGSHETDVL
jgi:hypothetical protein